MSVQLSKGQRVDLTKGRPSINKIMIGLGWDANRYDGEYAFDLDASAFLIQSDGKVKNDNDFIYYNNLVHTSKSVQHMGDERTGSTEGDDEVINVELNKIPANYTSIVIVATIYDAEFRLQNFGMVDNAYIRIVDPETNEELLRFDLSEDGSEKTALVFAEIYRHGNEWKFKAIGSGYNGGLAAICAQYGIDIE